MKIVNLDTVPSTNSYLLERGDLLAENFLAVRALRQTAGRGRHGRSWFSGGEKDLALSFVYHPPRGMNPATVTVLSGLALFRALKGLTGARLSLKWPNDIHFKGLKLSGILVEKSGLNSGALVVGIGVNVNSRGQDIPPIAVSLREITGRDFNPEEVLESVLAGQKKILEEARLPLDPSLMREFRTASSSIGRRVRYSGSDGTAEGVITGISSGCGLIIMNNNMEKEYLGEVEFIA